MRKIGIDLDDILLDFNGALVKFYNAKHGTNYTKDGMTSFFLEDNWGISGEQLQEELNEFYSSSYHKDADPIVGSIEAIAELAKDNELYIVTASPQIIEAEIRVWLGRHYTADFKHIHFTRKTPFDESIQNKKDACTGLGIEVFIDDALHNAENIALCGIPVFLLDSPWNQGPVEPPIRRVYSWYEIVAALKN